MTATGFTASAAFGPRMDIDLDAVARNFERYRAAVGVPILAMVKANGYGLGAVAVARALESSDPWGYGVATVPEAAELREAGIERPILAIVPFTPEAAPEYRRWRVRPLISDPAGLAAWRNRGAGPFHLAIDTGMARGGWLWRDDSLSEVGRTVAEAGDFEGVMTHFHSADSDLDATERQWARLHEAIGRLGTVPPLVHAANSAAGRFGTRFAGTLTRPGIFLYGGAAGDWMPEQVVRIEARVVAVEAVEPGDTVSYGATGRIDAPAEVAVLGIGYADGVLRSLSSRGAVEIHGRVYPIAGRVTMDMTMAILPRGTAAVGDTATMLGGAIGLDAQAARAGTISYELLTAVGRRVVRHYQGGPR